MPAAKKKTASDLYTEIETSLNAITANPAKFLTPQPQLCADVLQLIQKTYKATVETDTENVQHAEILPELVLEDMDDEQVWQQLELRNNIVLPQFVAHAAQIMAVPEENFEIHLDESDNEDEDIAQQAATDDEELNEIDEDEDDEDNDDEDNDDDDDVDVDDVEQEEQPIADDDDEGSSDSEEDEVLGVKPRAKNNKKPFKQTRGAVVEDKFFKLNEMEDFLDQEDAKEMHRRNGKRVSNGLEIDYFAEDLAGSEGSEDGNVNYREFFDVDDDNDVEKEEQEKEKAHKKPSKTAKIAKNVPNKDYFAAATSDEETQNVDDNDSDEENAKQAQSNAVAERLQPTTDSEDSDDDDNDDEIAEERDDDEAVNEQLKSSYEQRDARLQQRIRDYEQEVLGEKPWQLRGEVKATSRPQNSLLEELLEFESTTRPAPVITEATTRCLEDIIRQRIKDQAWDDVVTTARPTQTPQEYRKQLVLDQEKSKVSLAQIYEKEYQQDLAKVTPNNDDTIKPEPKEHQEIRRAMHELFVKLDALSNFHFTPKPVAPEAKIITNTPAVSMEEVAPLAISDAKLLAPEEVFRGPKNDPLGKTERTRTDKNRERRKKKQKQHDIHKALEARERERLKQGKKLTKKAEGVKLLKSITKQRNVQTIKTSNDHGSLKSSKAFFNKLQDTTTININGLKRNAKKPTDVSKVNAKKLKL